MERVDIRNGLETLETYRPFDEGDVGRRLVSHYQAEMCRDIAAVESWMRAEGESDEVAIDCYLHTGDHAAQGWYEPAARTARLSAPFRPPGARP